MNKAYTRINWQNQPSTTTALGATNLNKMDLALNEIDNRVVDMDTSKADASVVNNTVQSITYDDETGTLTITKVNGTSTNIDTKLEKLAVNFAYNPETQQLDITLDDGTVQHVDLSSLITQYEFDDSDTIGWTLVDGVIKADIINGSITAEKMQPDYLADITVQAGIATTQANLAKRYAVGGVEEGDATDNAKYYKEKAEEAAAEAQQITGFDPTTKIDISEKGIANGVATLGANGKVPSSQLPNIVTDASDITYDNTDSGLEAENVQDAIDELAARKTDALMPRLLVTVESGAVATVTNGTKTYQQTSTGSVLTFDVDGYGTWTASATKDSQTSNSVATVVNTVQIYNVALAFFASTITVTVDSGSTVTCAKSGTTTQTKTSTGTVVFTVTEAGTYTITATKDGNTASDTVSITASGQSKSITLSYVHIYGAIWDGTPTTAFSRTDDAAGFTNPVPYISGATSYGSPFDNLQPWAGMVRVTDAVAGELVAIPKYWYKWTKSGDTLKLQIADKATTGFYVSPAHADRGDSAGERDVVYVGRYHCNSAYKSVTGAAPQANITRASARTSIHNLGSNIWQYDFAMYWTIMMLYLVEFADWNSQAKIGYGCGNNSATQNVGASDSMPYHTGTMQASRTTYGVGCQYRYIEGLWDNIYYWCDGIYFSDANIYCIKNPSSFSDTANGTNIGTRPTSSGYISAWSVPSASGFEYALYPSAVAGSETTYICDYCNYNSSGVVLLCGSYYNQSQYGGLFRLNGSDSASSANAGVGCRLQKLP